MTEARTSNYVYIRSEEYAWIPGRLLETNTDKKEAIVSVAHFADEQDIKSGVVRDIKKYDKVTVNLKDYENQALLLQNVNDQGTLIEVQDMVDLPFLHEVCTEKLLFAHFERYLQYCTCSLLLGRYPLQLESTPSRQQTIHSDRRYCHCLQPLPVVS